MKGSVFLDKLSHKQTQTGNSLPLPQPASRFNDPHLRHANFWKSQQKAPMFRTYNAAEYVLPLCDFGPPSPFPPYLLCFTQLLLTAQSCCHQLSPATGLRPQQQELQELCLTPHNCLALISDVCSAKYWVIPAYPQEGFQCHFPWGPTRPLRIFVKEKRVAVTHPHVLGD